MECRIGCGACCIAPSINSALPGMPYGKKAGERCVNLSEQNLCLLFGLPSRPKFCQAYQAEEVYCGTSQDEAVRIIGWLEQMTD
ncbi:YkgJ family cysteine cluster protein [Pseudomonas sp. F1_0610]|uniref:YkgJ family cysteine cluster protein n=1 Tax=Pseudomonas sp. F1_0610 TaxID=3114284 RepID=UPI0039C1E335